MKAKSIRNIGYVRAVTKIALANLTYNHMRCVQLNKTLHNVFLWGSLRPVVAESLFLGAILSMNKRFSGDNCPD